MASTETHYLRSIMPSLPNEIASKIRSLCISPANESLLENLVRFISGAGHASDASKGIQDQWSEKQATTRTVLAGLVPALGLDKKRSREDDMMDDADSQQSKRQRVSLPTTIPGVDSGLPRFTLHAISVTSPVRKKVDITIYQNTIVMTNPTSRVVEATIPVSSMRRAFIVPTRGKSKPHWTVILLPSDIPDKVKPAPGSLTSSENQQVIFGMDEKHSSQFTTTTYNETGNGTPKLFNKGSCAIPSIREFLGHLSMPFFEISLDQVFKSVCPSLGGNAGVHGIPGVEAYRGAKAGNLWFSKHGILWGQSKPCEFWAVGDLISKKDGVRMVGSGRTCTVILTRRNITDGAEEDMKDDEEDMGEETEFGMVDGREREGINEWVRNHRHLFGKNGPSKGKIEEEYSPPPNLTIQTLQQESDDEDEDFSASISDLDGSEASSDGNSSDHGGEGSDGEGGREDGEGGGGGPGSGGPGSDDDDDIKKEDEEDDLDPAKHPLLRPGAMPRMSHAALEMAVGIVKNEFLDGGEQEDDHDELDEEDELDD